MKYKQVTIIAQLPVQIGDDVLQVPLTKQDNVDTPKSWYLESFFYLYYFQF